MSDVPEGMWAPARAAEYVGRSVVTLRRWRGEVTCVGHEVSYE